MNLSTITIIFIISYYTKYTLTLIFNKNKRKGLQELNKKLNVFRQQSIKTVEEQKAFLDIKYPKYNPNRKFKLTWKKTFNFIFTIIWYGVTYRVIKYIFEYYNITFSLWQAILLMIFIPLIINFIYSKFGIENNNLTQMIK